jgi:hypothetical protein
MCNKIISLAILVLISIQTQAQNLVRFYEKAKVGYKLNNEIIVKPIYEAGSEMQDGIAIVVYNNKKGFINNKGQEFISCIYSDASQFCNGMAAVAFAGKYGYINKKGEWLIQPLFEKAFDFSDGKACVMRNGKYGFINPQGSCALCL